MLYLGIDQHARQLMISLRDEQGDVLPRISQMTSLALACDLRHTPEKQGFAANLCQAERGTRWVTAKTRICVSVLTVA